MTAGARAVFRQLRPAWASSLRWKVALTVTAASCTVAVVLGVLVHNVVARQTIERERTDAVYDLEEAVGYYSYGMTAQSTRWALDPPGLPRELRELTRRGMQGSMVGSRDGRPVMWAATPAEGQILAVWSPYGKTRSHLEQVDAAIIASAAAAALVVTLAGLVIAGRISRRLTGTAAVARRITQGDLDARVGMSVSSTPGADRDEVRAVAEALDSMAGALHDRLETEKRFTADVAHDLRTPLAGLLAAAGVLPEGRPKEMITERIKALHLLTEDLLEISRLDTGTEQADLETHDLAPLVRRAVRATGLPVEVRIVRDAHVLTDRRRLDRVLTNLITNADKHGRPPTVVTVDRASVEVRDHGPGYPQDILDHGPQRFRTGDPGRGRGHGLGLTIVAGQAAVIGTGLHFANAPDGGARTVLSLPAVEDTSLPPTR